MFDAEHHEDPVGELAAHFDVGDLELMLEQREHVGDDGVEIDVDALVGRRARPREVQQSVHDLRGPERLPLDLLEQRRLRVAWRRPLQQHLRVARDPGQRRVHLMGDARGEEPD